MPTVDRQDNQLYYEDAGAGAAIVLGHSFLCSGTMWREQVPTLSRTHRVLNVDFRGHGRSGPIDRPFTIHDAVDDVVAVLDHAGIDSAVWCGLSIGGMVALRAALTRPERVAALILMDTDADADTTLRKLRYRAMGLGVRLAGIRRFLPAIARLMFGTTTRRGNPALVDTWKTEAAEVHVPSVLRVLDALMRRDSVVERLGDIRVPALILVGAEDRSLPPKLSQRIHARLHDSRLAVIPEAGHLSALEQPARVNAAVLAFLGGLAA
ncbi:MAG: alpha/beta fold hydrolase [Gemmatimonadota bacterium]|nr:alpha/beta fold hydrolase [Gemmatimonadota bacterium]